MQHNSVSVGSNPGIKIDTQLEWYSVDGDNKTKQLYLTIW